MSWFQKMIRTLTGTPAPAGSGQHPLLEAYETRARGLDRVYEAMQQPEAQDILDAPPEDRAQIAAECAENLVAGTGDGWGRTSLVIPRANLLTRLLRANLPFDADQLEILVRGMTKRRMANVPAGVVVVQVERFAAAHPIPGSLEAACRAFADQLGAHATKGVRKYEKRLLEVLPKVGGAFPFEPDGPWGTLLAAWYPSLDPDAHGAWEALFVHANRASASRPSRKWSATAEPLVGAVPGFASQLTIWLDTIDVKQRRFNEFGLTDLNEGLMKGLLWAAATRADPTMAATISRFGERCFVKIPSYGAASLVLGNAVLAALEAMPDGAGVAQLTRLQGKVRYPSARARIDRALAAVGDRTGQSRDELEELAVPDFGLDADSTKRVAIAGYEAIVRVVDGTAELRFVNAKGKALKSVPKPVRDLDPDGLKALRAEVKDLKGLAEGQARRIENLWTTGRTLTLEQLRTRYLEHPVVGPVARRLLWNVTENGATVEGFWQDGALADLGGRPLTASDAAEVTLWHPLTGASDLQMLWRDRFEELGVEQPFAQLWRAVYRADEEPGQGECRRFAGALMEQRRLVDECQRRGWQYQVQGYFDSANDPSRAIPNRDLTADLQVEPVQHASDAGIFRYIASGAVVFGRPDGTPVRMEQVDPLLLSEILRDVDQLVSRASVGRTAPVQGFAGTYSWDAAAFGPLTALGRTRRDVLARVLPRLRIASACRLEGPWLIVQSPAHEARIHLGSTQVQAVGTPIVMKPSKKSVNAAKKVFLPFEGDSALPVVLAKAFAIADGEPLDG